MGSRGRPKQSRAVNLLKGLREYRQDVWRFASDAGVPFSNNLAEQVLRMATRVRQFKLPNLSAFQCNQGLSNLFCGIL